MGNWRQWTWWWTLVDVDFQFQKEKGYIWNIFVGISNSWISPTKYTKLNVQRRKMISQNSTDDMKTMAYWWYENDGKFMICIIHEWTKAWIPQKGDFKALCNIINYFMPRPHTHADWHGVFTLYSPYTDIHDLENNNPILLYKQCWPFFCKWILNRFKMFS